MTPTGPGSSFTAGQSHETGGVHCQADSRPAAVLAPAAVAIVYLPLHRTRALTVTEQTLTFGFRAASTDDAAEMPGLAAIADLDLMQARRHAAILAGHLLAADLAVLRQADDAAAWRGLAAVEHEWADRGQATGRAAMFDCQLDLPGSPSLEQACQQAGIVSPPAPRRGADSASRPSGGGAGGGAGADDRAALRPAPGPLRLDRNAAHRAGHGCRHMGLPPAGPDRPPVRAYEAAVADRADAAPAVTRGSQ